MMNDVVSGAESLGGQAEQAPSEGVQEGNAATENHSGEQQNSAPWYGELDGDMQGWVENKGWKTPKDALQSARNLEKLLGADKAGNALVVPKEGDQEGWNAFYDRLGRPQSPDEYKFNLSEGDQESELGQWFRSQAHELGLTQQQAANLFESFDERAQAMMQDHNAQTDAQSQQDMKALQKEWGQAYDENLMAAKKAARQFELDQDSLSKIEGALGTKSMMELMSKIGNAIGEHSFETGTNRAGGFGLTPAAAKNQIGELKSDPEFQKAYMDPQHFGHKDAVTKMQRLTEAAYPEKKS